LKPGSFPSGWPTKSITLGPRDRRGRRAPRTG